MTCSNGVSVPSRRWKHDNEKLWGLKLCLREIILKIVITEFHIRNVKNELDHISS